MREGTTRVPSPMAVSYYKEPQCPVDRGWPGSPERLRCIASATEHRMDRVDVNNSQTLMICY